MYLVECSDHSIYCGITKSIESRIKAHNLGKGAKYTRSRRPVKLLAYASVGQSRSFATKAEIAFKQLTKKQKLFYISKGLHFFLQDNS